LEKCGYDFEARLRDLASHMKGADGLVRPREIRREAVKPLEARDCARGVPVCGCVGSFRSP
jgi:hypothetical protein